MVNPIEEEIEIGDDFISDLIEAKMEIAELKINNADSWIPKSDKDTYIEEYCIPIIINDKD